MNLTEISDTEFNTELTKNKCVLIVWGVLLQVPVH